MDLCPLMLRYDETICASSAMVLTIITDHELHQELPNEVLCSRPQSRKQQSRTWSFSADFLQPPLLEQTIGEHFESVVSRFGDRIA